MSELKRIWLQPECCATPDVGRLWCEHDEPEPCPDGEPWVEYVRADEITRLRAVSGVIQDDMAALMEVLGISTHARDATPHMVMHGEVIPEARRLRAENERIRAGPQWMDVTPVEDVSALRARVEKLTKALLSIQRRVEHRYRTGVGWSSLRMGEVEKIAATCRRALRGETDG